jgi:plastocyanin
MRRLLFKSSVVLLAVSGLALVTGDRLDAGGASVAVVDFAFQPGGVQVSAGGTVSWTNNGESEHTVTASDGSFNSGTLSPGAGFSSTFSTPGTFSYNCTLHPEMTGTVTVTGVTAPEPSSAPAPTGTEDTGTTTGPVVSAPSVTG